MSGYIRPAVVDGIERPCANCDSVSLHFLDHGSAECGSYKPAVMDRAFTPAFAAILRAAHDLGQPRHYTSDLFRDYQALVCEVFGELPREFLWAIGDTGTHLVWGDSRTCNVRTIARLWPTLAWYWWDGARLHRTAVPEAIESEISRRKISRTADHDTYRARSVA